MSHHYWSIFALIFNQEEKVLLNKRQNTWYYDGWRTLIAWHIEKEEFAKAALVREIKEECWLIVDEKDLIYTQTLHRFSTTPWREYIDICFYVNKWIWTPTIMEPEKCTDLERFELDNLPDYMPEENFHFLENYKKGNIWIYTELDVRHTP